MPCQGRSTSSSFYPVGLWADRNPSRSRAPWVPKRAAKWCGKLAYCMDMDVVKDLLKIYQKISKRKTNKVVCGDDGLSE